MQFSWSLQLFPLGSFTHWALDVLKPYLFLFCPNVFGLLVSANAQIVDFLLNAGVVAVPAILFELTGPNAKYVNADSSRHLLDLVGPSIGLNTGFGSTIGSNGGITGGTVGVYVSCLIVKNSGSIISAVGILFPVFS